MSDPQMILEIKKTVSIPVMAKVRIGHFVEAQILEALGIDFIDESEVLTPADEQFHVNKHDFNIPFVCGATNLGEALRRINEGAAMIRTKGEAGTGNIIEAVKHIRTINAEMEKLINAKGNKTESIARSYKVPVELCEKVRELKKLPVVNFAAGGVATPADAAMVMQLGVEGVFVGSGIFKSSNPSVMAKAIVEAVHNFEDAEKITKASKGLGAAMPGLEIDKLQTKMARRGW
jgi:pyridoxal 5'-phosphate synthase pdxS subunit